MAVWLRSVSLLQVATSALCGRCVEEEVLRDIHSVSSTSQVWSKTGQSLKAGLTYHHLFKIRLAINKKSHNTMCWQDVGKGEHSYFLAKVYIMVPLSGEEFGSAC